jgi:hypothetical protein
MAGQRTTTDDDDTAGPPPMAAVTAARRAEMEEAQHRPNRQSSEMTISIYPGVLVIIIAALSAIAVWMAS